MTADSILAVPSCQSAVPAKARIFELVREAAGGAEMDAETSAIAAVLVTALSVGHNVARLSRITGVAAPVVSKCARRLFDNGVWCEGRTVGTWQVASGAIDHPESFWADVHVAQGKLCRRMREDGSPEWAPVGHWWKDYDLVRPGTSEPVSATYHARTVVTDENPPYLFDVEAEEEEQESVVSPPKIEPAPPAASPFLGGFAAADAWLPGSVGSAPAGHDAPDVAHPDLEPASAGSELFPSAVWLG